METPVGVHSRPAEHLVRLGTGGGGGGDGKK